MAGKGKQRHEKKDKRGSDEEGETHHPEEKIEEPQEQEEEETFKLIAPKKVSYCPVCSMTFELCRYGKEAPECAAFLFKLAPAKVTKYHPDFKPEQVEQTKHAKEKGEEEEKVEKQKEKPKSLKEKYVVIDVKNRGRKNYITTVSGLNNFNVDCKELSKKCSKKFAVSCSVTETGTVQMQGDNFQAMRDFLLAEYKQLKKKYLIDKEDFNEKMAEENAKKKEAKKLDKNAIKEEPEEEEKEKVEEPVKNFNQIRMEMAKKAEEEEDQDD